MDRCPGQDQRYLKPSDVFEVPCPECGHMVEFFKFDVKLNCRGCGREMRNPKLDLGCAKWCKYADKCLGDLEKGRRLMQDDKKKEQE